MRELSAHRRRDEPACVQRQRDFRFRGGATGQRAVQRGDAQVRADPIPEGHSLQHAAATRHVEEHHTACSSSLKARTNHSTPESAHTAQRSDRGSCPAFTDAGTHATAGRPYASMSRPRQGPQGIVALCVCGHPPRRATGDDGRSCEVAGPNPLTAAPTPAASTRSSRSCDLAGDLREPEDVAQAIAGRPRLRRPA